MDTETENKRQYFAGILHAIKPYRGNIDLDLYQSNIYFHKKKTNRRGIVLSLLKIYSRKL